MSRRKKIAVALALTLTLTGGSMVSAAGPELTIRETLQGLQADMPIEAIAESPISGLYQIALKGGRQLYASADGQYLMQGYLFQVKDGQAINLTEQAESQGIAREINAIPVSDMVVFRPENPKTHITVFTDTDCGYCQKLHSEMAELNKLGVEVRYVAFPRQGIGSEGYNTLVNVWCASDKQQAMNRAKRGQSVADAKCENPVEKQYQLGQLIGVRGTPAIVLANGQLIPGYQPAAMLAREAMQAQ